MKIMSWNILAAEWIKSSYYPQIDKKTLFDRAARFQRILAILQNAEADIILLQEVMPSEYAMLLKHLHKHYFCSPLVPIQWKYAVENKKKENGKSGNMTLLRRSEKQFKAAKHYAFAFGLYTELPQLGICNIHLDDLANQTRNKQIKLLEKDILYRRPQCILGGDFNQAYRANSYIYHLPEFTVQNIECPTYYIAQKMNIDNIMTRGFFEKKEKKGKKEEKKCMQYPTSMEAGIMQYGSDHLPVVVDI